jgi:putative cardiolipin synthase
VLAAGGCASVDFDAPKEVSTALTDTADTALGRALANAGPRPADQSGFLLLSDGIDALAARLLLAERAEKSLDVQYYLVTDDIIGRVFFASLLAAADRGVRVRLLIDDLGTRGMEDTLAAINQHPRLQLRLFNPFASRGIRAADAWDFQRLNRRMHNKSFTADNQITIIGGRNIATEYFAANSEYNFGDLDTVATGPVVQDTSDMFDSYWNHSRAVPFEQLSESRVDGEAALAALRESLKGAVAEIRDSPYADAVGASFDKLLAGKAGRYIWADYLLAYDAPDKSIVTKAGEAARITEPLAEAIRATGSELLVISPYFVPLNAGIEGVSRLARQGVQVDVVTNGLASSDHILVYGGYAPSRKPLLTEGVRFFEVRGDLVLPGTDAANTTEARSSLHTKAFVADRRYFFLGSFNWDPRSVELNTELGILIDSPEMASEVARLVYEAAPSKSYEVFLQDDKLRWRAFEDGREVIYDREPDTSWWTRTLGNLSRLLPIRSQL